MAWSFWSQQPVWLTLTEAGVIGAVIGSFLNVVIARLPVMMARDQAGTSEPRFDLWLPPSACPHCGHRLSWAENIPLISYLLLGGRCSTCRQAISWRYPLVEAAAAVAAVPICYRFGFGEHGFQVCVFAWYAIAIMAIDLTWLLIPDVLSLSLLWVGLLVAVRKGGAAAEGAILGAAAGYSALWLVSRFGRRVMGREVMGLGDAKLLAAIGAWVGVAGVLKVTIFSCFLGSIIGGAYLILSGKSRHHPIPFGPFLLMAAMTVLIDEKILGRWHWSVFPF